MRAGGQGAGLTWCEDSQAGQCHHFADPVPGEAAVGAFVRHSHPLDLEPACHFIFLGPASELQGEAGEGGSVSVSAGARKAPCGAGMDGRDTRRRKLFSPD